MNIFIFPDIFDQLDNGSIVASVDLIEDSGLITSSFDSSIDPYDNLGLISVTSTPATGQITLDSNPPQTLNYYTNYTDSSSDYGTLITRVDEIEDLGLIASAVDEIDPYGLIATPIYSYGTTSKSIKYGFDSILYLESPENFGLITENPYIQYGFLTDSVTYTDYGSVSDSLPANQYTDYGNNDVLAADVDYGLIVNPYDETVNYDFIFYNETVYPFGSFTISGSAAESFIPQTAVGSGSIAAEGVAGEAITDFYGIDSSYIDTSIESSINYGLVSASVDETEDYGLVIDAVTEVDSYGFLYPLLTSFGAFNISGSAGERFKPATFIGSGSIVESGIPEEKNTDSYTIDSILLGSASENYGTVNTLATESESNGLIVAPVDATEDYHYIFYAAGETVYPYGTVRISGESRNELKIRFIYEGSGSIAAEGVAGEAITDFYGIDSAAIDTSIESSINYGLINASVDETEDYGLIIASANEADSYGFLYPLLTSFGAFNIGGTAGERFVPTGYKASGSIVESGILEEKNVDSYNLDSILLGESPEDYGTVNTSAGTNESYGLITAPVDAAEDYDYIFYTAGETVYPYGTVRISGESRNELKIQFTQEGSGSISANGVAGEAITDFYGIDSSYIDTSIESSINYGLIDASIDETEDYGLVIDAVTEVDSYGFLYPLLTSFGAFRIIGSAGESFKPSTYIGSGSIVESGVLEEKNVDSYNLGSILPGSASEDYGTVNTSAGTSESYGLVSAPVDQVENYDYIFYPAGETITPFGTIRISGESFNELKIQFTQIGSGSISANGVAGEAITKFYGVDSDSIDTSIEFSTSYGLISDSIDDTEDYGLITSSATEIDVYGFLYPRIVPFGLFNISGSAGDRFSPSSYIASGSIVESGVLEEKNTDSYNIDSILLGGSPEDYGTVNTSATTNESYGLLGAPVDAAENYDYIFYPAGETVYPYGTIQISGESFNELKIQFTQIGSGSISANGVAGEAITKFYGVDSDSIDTSIEFSTSYGLISDSIDDTEDYGLITSSATEIDVYGFLYPRIVPFGLFNISGSAGDRFSPSSYIASGSIIESGVLEEKNVDSYNIDSVLLGGSLEDYGTVNTSAGTSESYGLVSASIDQIENYDYIFYPAGETVYPYGTIQVSGSATTELKIQFTQEGSGSISASGVAGEAITDFYGIDSAAIDTSIESSINYGLIDVVADETEDYGLVIDAVTEVDSYGFLYPLLTSFGAFNISGSAAESFKPAAYIGSGSIVESGILEEKNTDSYTIDSILLGGSPEDYGTVDTSATTSDNFELITATVDQAEDYDYIFYPAGETVYSFGTIQISGSAVTELKIQFTQEGSGSIAAEGVAGEAITKFYSVDSIEVDTSVEFSTSYGLITNAVDETEDYGLITNEVTEVDSYGFLYPVITPYGLFNISGSAGQRFKPSFIGSGSVQESGTKIEKNTDSYNLGSILPGSASEDYGTVNTSATESESYGLVTAPIDQVEDCDYIFYPAGETVYPYGTIQISGSARERSKPGTAVGSGTINITGYVLIPQRYSGSGRFSAFGGGADVSGSNPPDQTVPIVISGGYTNLKSTNSNIGSGTAVFSGTAGQKYNPGTEIGSGTIRVSGTVAESFVPQTYTGSGRFSAFGGGADVSGSNPPDQTVPIVISGAASDLKNTYSNVGSGTIVISGDAGTEVRGKPQWEGTGTIEISGTAAESFIPTTAIGSGTLFAIGGGAEVSGSNPPDQTVPIVISGAATNLKNTYSNVGSGTIVISAGITTGRQIYVPSFPGSGTAIFSGTVAESFVPQTYTGSGSFSSFGGAAEVSGSNPPDQTVPIVISGAASDLKNTYSNVGSGTGVFSGNRLEKETKSYVGSGTGVFSGTAGERFKPATAVGSGTLFAVGGAAEVSGSNPPDRSVLFTFSGNVVQKRRISEVGSGTLFAIGGGAEVSGSNPPDQVVPIVISGGYSNLKSTYSNVGSGRFSSFGGGAEVKGSNPPDQNLIITLSGNAKERFIPATAVGSGTIFESGNGIEKNTESDVGIGTVAITGGITPNIQIYVPSFTGSGSFSGFGGAAEVSGSNPPDRFVLFTFSGTAGEAFVPQTAVGSGTINISGVGVGVSNPYRAPFVYVTII